MNIKKLREHLGLTQVKFAELLGTTQITVSAWENGRCPEYIETLAGMVLAKETAQYLSTSFGLRLGSLDT